MTARWWHLAIACRVEDADAVAAAIIATTGFAVEEPHPGSISAVAATDVDARRLAAEMAAAFPGLEASVTELEPVDWTVRWRDGIVTRQFGRLVITPSWLPIDAPEGAAVVVLDPESAFGSGEHGSTRAALALLERHLQPGDRVLDFGSGSGILAIAAVRLGASMAIGIEVDDEAIPIAEANAARNDVTDRVRFLLGDAEALGALAGPARIVCSNILRTVNALLLPAIRDALAPDGLAIFAGMEDAEAELFRPVLAEAGWQVVDEVHDAGWWGVVARRPA
ncbi:MAG: 50S ribosomal protein L11 methyltransferase [Gemmatimonadales bacterium]|nr:50S ribosomal protein L11 methyltransferase [Gemmatimonadota bacterium]MCA9768730.1 50S ribosomal protein L11 methyltransferase [Gemmatimonadota bacterium]MCB9517374.1 50S ribosomal protein L11 methyltransferase [Gemmatimonadales bacterium]HPF62074.1 50S ribosomal protein L11 methyltransferase [Gemmatimonadales bacterium]HRX17910.1 50S ribosomal protein L11 methyltransferase [Gemmatimonadales bacterium]